MLLSSLNLHFRGVLLPLFLWLAQSLSHTSSINIKFEALESFLTLITDSSSKYLARAFYIPGAIMSYKDTEGKKIDAPIFRNIKHKVIRKRKPCIKVTI